MKSQLIGKYPDAGKDWEQEEKEVAEDEKDRQHYWFNEHEFEQTLGDMKDRESWCVVHQVAKSRTQSSNWKTTNVLFREMSV